MDHAFDVPVAIRRMVGSATIDDVLGTLAETQHGVVSRRQLAQLGLSPSAVDRRLRAGRLRPLHRGVFAVGHRALRREGRWMAALLACGPGAVLSHRSAAERLGLRATTLLEVSVPVARRARSGIRLHRSAPAADEVEWQDGIPATTTARTLLDLAAVLPSAQVEMLFEEAEYRQLSSPVGVPELLERYPGRPGAPTLRAVLAVRRGRKRTIGEAEFHAFLDAHGLPRPQSNVPRELRGRRIETDGVYPEARLIIEIDGGSHMTGRRFHEDRSRDRANLVEGWRTVRVSRLDGDLADDLRTLLARG